MSELLAKIEELVALTKGYYDCCNGKGIEAIIFSGDTIIANKNTIHELLINQGISRQWWNITEIQRRKLGEYIIRNFLPRRQVTNIGEEKDGAIVWRSGSCVSNALLRYAKMQEPMENQKRCYYLDGGEHCYAEEAFFLPCYCVGCDGYDANGKCNFGHELCALLVKEGDEANFDSWIFFQYSSIDIKPGNWQMPRNSDVMIEELIDAGCSWINHKTIVKWHI